MRKMILPDILRLKGDYRQVRPFPYQGGI